MEDWNQTSVAEQKRLQIARERSNKISKILGDYLLKGYKMLGSTCNKCQTILLEDRQGEDYCVGCIEVDCSPQPDVTQVHLVPHTSRIVDRQFPVTGREHNTVEEIDTKYNCINDVNSGYEVDMEREVIDVTIRKLIEQIKWSNECLTNIGNNATQRMEYVMLIKTCYQTLELLRPGLAGS